MNHGRRAPVEPPKQLIQSTPQDIQLLRSRLFFSRPDYVPGTNLILAGLPTKHILNKMYPSFPMNQEGLSTENVEQPFGKGGREQPDQDRDMEKNTRHLSKYIFPGQYGLSSTFQYASNRRVYPNYLDREDDIKANGACKTPKRIREILPLVDKLLWRHRKCDYKALQNIACPSKVKEAGRVLEASVILEMLSEQSIQLATQASLRLDDISVDSAGSQVKPLGPTQLSKQAPSKPKFVEFECSHYEVFRYASLVTDAVIPKAFWGSKANYTLVLRNLKRFIACRRYETFTLHRLLQGFSTSDCEWLMPPGHKAQVQGRVCVSDSLKRRELLEEFMFWYFDGFIMPLLKTTFYITESSAFRNRILYFRHDDWKTLCAPLTERLLETTFEPIPGNQVREQLQQRKLGYSFVRLLPKDTGVRPIVNLKGSTGKTYGGKILPVNIILRTAFDILTYERMARTELLGASVLGPDQVYLQLKSFKEHLLHARGKLPKLYFVKVDVQAAFDTICQNKLIGILTKLILSEEKYSIQRYGQVQLTNGLPKRAWKRKAQPATEEPHFLKVASDIAGHLWNTVVCGLHSPYRAAEHNKEDIVLLLQEHIGENMVKIGKKFYKQKVGIPQGSILSTMLCSFFYGDLETHDERLAKLRRDPGSLLMRLVDDYLFVTTDLSRARLFLDIMNQGHPEYGCFIGKEKTLTNIDYDVQIMNRIDPSLKSFPWCGYLINMADLSVTVDYSRYETWGIRNTLTIEHGKKAGSTFLNKMLVLARAKCHVIYSDTDLNTEPVVYLNIYQNMLLTALKMQQYLVESKLLSRNNTAFVHKAIQRIVNVSYSSVLAQAKRKARLNGGRDIPCSIKKPATLWLGYQAFHHVLSHKAQYFRALLPLLEKELHRVQNRSYKRRFKQLVREGQSAFDFEVHVA